VVYQRGSDRITVKATVGSTRFESEDTLGRILQSSSRDYLITAADLVFDSEQVEPAAGDRIIETLAGVDRAFEVMPQAGAPAFAYSDQSNLTLRVHTKYVGVDGA
jgi:hypothetical protein